MGRGRLRHVCWGMDAPDCQRVNCQHRSTGGLYSDGRPADCDPESESPSASSRSVGKFVFVVESLRICLHSPLVRVNFCTMSDLTRPA